MTPNHDLPRWFTGWDVFLLFTIPYGVIFAITYVPRASDVAAVTYPIWIPAYLSLLGATWIRNSFFAALSSDVFVYGLAAVIMYIEAVVLAQLFRVGRTGYQHIVDSSQR